MAGGRHKKEPVPVSLSLTDEELLGLVADGDQTAFGMLAERLTPRLRRVLFRLGLSETAVDDTLQDTLVKVWQGSAGFKGRSTVSTWACRVAMNGGLSSLRAGRNQALGPAMAVVDTEAVWESRREAETVREAVMDLPIPLRAVIVLREYEDFSYRSIAEVLGIPIGTVMSRLHTARARLRNRLA
jgi:RNA polymerase sigma-70 factor (ECF subfamily)